MDDQEHSIGFTPSSANRIQTLQDIDELFARNSPGKSVSNYNTETQSNHTTVVQPDDNKPQTVEQTDTKAAIIACVKSWCESCSAHGFGHMISAEQIWMKIIWLISIICVLIYCIFSLANSTATYLSQATTTSIANVRAIKQEFPEITICNMNVFDTKNSTTNAYLADILVENGFELPLNATKKPSRFLMYDAVTSLKGTLIDRYAKGNITSEFIQSLGFSIQDSLISCGFNLIPCHPWEFIHYQTYKYGNCYSFNHLKDADGDEALARQSWSGKKHALELELFTGIPGVQDKYSTDSGYFILINNRTSVPYTDQGGFHVSPGFKTNLAITRVNYNSISTNSNPCRSDLTVLPSDSVYFKYTSMLTAYSHDTCHDVFVQMEIIVKNCGCLDAELIPNYDMVKIFNKNICITEDQEKCVRNILPAILNVEVSYADCPIECSTEAFHVNMDITSYPTESYLRLLETGRFGRETKFGTSDLDKIKDSLLYVSIYYENPWYTVIDTSLVMTSDTYIALIGGILGLCIGMSFISFVEVFLLLVNISRILLGHFCDKSKPTKGEKK